MPHFIYPYNFVCLPCSETEPNETMPPERRSAPAHRRFNGLSGAIHATLRPLTPLAVPDTGKEIVEADGHRKYPFMTAAGKHAIPGTACKGMIRSVYEAVTNSCILQLSPLDPRYRKRMTGFKGTGGNFEKKDQTLYLSVKAGRVVHLNGALHIRPMAWVYLMDDPLAPGPLGSLKAERIGRLKDSDKWGKDAPEKQRAFNHLNRVNGQAITHTIGFQINGPAARLASGTIYHLKQAPAIKANDWGRKNQVTISAGPGFETFEAVFSGISGGTSVFQVTGYLRVAGWFKKKHGDFLFVEMTRRNPDILITTEMRNAYREANRDNPFQLHEIQEGDTVWYQEGRKYGFGSNRLQAGYAQIFPFVSPFSLQEKIPQSHHPCNGEALCPACRLFGAGGLDAFSGRVRFQDAPPQGTMASREMPLKELAGPKPSYEPFYMRPKQLADRLGLSKNLPPSGGKLNAILDTFAYGDDRSTIRGRKCYLHHNNGNFDPTTAEDLSWEGRDRRVTVEALLPDHENDAHFNLCVSFRNLHEWELGLLLFSMDPSFMSTAPTRYAHKLGRGRPLGLGSVGLDIETVSISTPGIRFSQWTDETSEHEDAQTLSRFRILGIYWLLEQFLSDVEKETFRSAVRKETQVALLNHIASKLLMEERFPAQFQSLLLFNTREETLSALTIEGRVFETVSISVPDDFEDRWGKALDESSPDEQDTLEVLSDQEILAEACAVANRNAPLITAPLFPKILEMAQTYLLKIQHICELLTLLQWDPPGLPSNLRVRYPRNTGQADNRGWFGANYRPLPLPEDLSTVNDWTLED